MKEKEYWDQLIKEVDTFDKKESKIDSILDQNEYKKLRDTLKDIAHYGLKSLSFNPLVIKECIQQIETLMEIAPFDKKGIPTISGKKTKNFIELVYLPHLRRLKDVEFSVATKMAAKLLGKDISTERIKGEERIKKLEELLKSYEEQKIIPKSSLFLQPPVPSSQSSMESRPSSSNSLEVESTMNSLTIG
ncbi:MAG: hypothetical protein JO131_08995 [Gammaproteobacteria bacterium]|nr:hypothetical protein [Gammaproteobacteria bacterium]